MKQTKKHPVYFWLILGAIQSQSYPFWIIHMYKTQLNIFSQKLQKHSSQNDLSSFRDIWEHLITLLTKWHILFEWPIKQIANHNKPTRIWNGPYSGLYIYDKKSYLWGKVNNYFLISKILTHFKNPIYVK